MLRANVNVASTREFDRRNVRDDSRGVLHPSLASFVGLGSMRELGDELDMSVRGDGPVLILGESGTGKTALARAIAEASGRKPTVRAVLGMSDDLNTITSELFGHERGAFSGATSKRIGLVEFARQGTLIFDELLNLPMHAQNLLLDFVQFGTYRPLGFDGPEPRVAQTRIIAATNGDLGAAIRGGRFRADLFHRLASTILELPPLRCRREDILPLAHTALRRVDPHRSWTLSVPLQRLLVSPALEWPGNVRQLEHVVLRARERALVRTPMATELDLEHVEARHLERVLVLSGVRTSLSTLDCTPEAHLEVAWQNLQSARDRIQTREAELIQQAILVSGGVVAHAAKELGIARTTLASRMAVLGIRSGRRDSSLSLKCPPTPSTPLLDTETVGRRLG